MKMFDPLAQGINMDDIPKVIKSAPQYTQLLLGFTEIDKFVKNVVKDMIESHTSNSDAYYIKTELKATSYTLFLFNSELQTTVATTWPIGSFLQQCEAKTISFDVENRTIRMIKALDNVQDESNGEILWIQ